MFTKRSSRDDRASFLLFFAGAPPCRKLHLNSLDVRAFDHSTLDVVENDDSSHQSQGDKRRHGNGEHSNKPVFVYAYSTNNHQPWLENE